MASYTDRPSSLSEYVPYVQQVPVEAYTQVGMQKQAMYNQGVQKIQSQIDQVAGLSLMRDVDKSYLKSKLSQLNLQLKGVSMGDFSNQQLVNSVGGMVNQIGNDPNIINAVQSTANASKQGQIIDAARTKGEGAPENEYDYYRHLNKYLSSTTPGEVFNDKYTPYVDVNKKLLTIADKIGVDEKTVQELFKTDSTGKLILNPDGTPQWNPIMAERHLKGKDPAKILDAFQTSLTPADYNQLAITGRYMRAGSSPEKLQGEIMKSYGENISLMSGKIEEIKIALASEDASNTKDPIKIQSLNKQLE